ncbi:uncharacterized protein LOC130667517 [Microplitis mediator]|uniref:uncharacterized protein LOC130667517 n=1 Tax=Microplitis mediator TaxID=375433 RepID=UPI00255324AD|nr:uncharacterized protein LOC130667517 [Microplitis mediator]XP_057325131.1 uncharacterized protein LOC130667517 [Microplitis mediator]
MGKAKGKNAKNSDKKKNNLKPMKIAALIISAIQELKETKGSTPNKITGYISYASNLPETRVKRQVNTALRRGVEYGILRRYRGQYFLPTGDELDRANRIAERFARLPTPVPSGLKLGCEENIRGTTADSFRNTKKIKSRKADAISKQRGAQSLPATPATSLSEVSWDRGDHAMRASDFE